MSKWNKLYGKDNPEAFCPATKFTVDEITEEVLRELKKIGVEEKEMRDVLR